LKPLSPQQVKDLAADESVFVIDCRPNMEYIQGHVQRSVWVPLEMTFAIWAAFVVDPRKGEKVVLVTPPGREREAITRLTRTGIDSVIGYLEGGFDAWKQAGFDVEETQVVDYESHEEFELKIQGATIVDVRNLGEWQDGVLDRANL
jgi:hydroxyacylglutathione hydrolase